MVDVKSVCMIVLLQARLFATGLMCETGSSAHQLGGFRLGCLRFGAVLDRALILIPLKTPCVQGRGRTESGGSAASESGALEPPPTPEGSSLASIQAASALYSSSLQDRFDKPTFKSAARSQHSCPKWF